MADEDAFPTSKQLDSLSERYEKEGIDARFLEEPFLEASELGDPPSLRQRLAGLSPDERRRVVKSVDQQGRSGLLLAVRRGDVEVARVLLDNGANPNDIDSGGVTALHYAGSAGNGPIIDLLLETRADAEQRDDQGETALMWARSSRAVGLLLAGGADAGSKSSTTGKTALMLASDRGDLASIELLAKAPDMYLDEVDAEGRSAHWFAVAAGNPEAGELLAKLGAKVSEAAPATVRKVASLDEALHDAVRRGDAAGCASLLEGSSGVDVNARLGGETPLLAAAGMGAGRTMEVLIKGRADVNLVEPYLNESPLLRAVLSHCSLEVLWMLLEARADPNFGDLSGRTPASLARSWGNADAVEILTAASEGELDLGGMD